jgi:hypothetical protein
MPWAWVIDAFLDSMYQRFSLANAGKPNMDIATFRRGQNASEINGDHETT